MVLSTQEKSSWLDTLWYSWTQVELPFDITENSIQIIHDAANLFKLLLVMDNLFGHFQKETPVDESHPPDNTNL